MERVYVERRWRGRRNLRLATSCMIQIAADYAHKSDTFAVIAQPFLSQAKADTFPTDYLSSVSIKTVNVCGADNINWGTKFSYITLIGKCVPD